MKKSLIALIYLAGSAAVGGALLWFTPLGLGQTPDSIAYLKGAQGLLTGHGTSYMSGQWPPLYPMAIASSAFLFDQDVIFGARVLQALLYVSNFLLTAWILRRVANTSTLLSILMAGLLCLHPVMMHIHFYAWSEPLFIAFMLADFLVLRKIAQTSLDLKLVLLLAFVSGLALVTRFVGVAIIVANCAVFLWIFWSLPRRRLVVAILIQMLVPIALYTPWIGHQAVSDGTATERWLTFSLPSIELIAKALATLGTWLLPWLRIQYDPPRNILTITFGCLFLCLPLVFAIFSGLRSINRAQVVTQTIVASLTVCYVGFVLAAWMFIDSKVHLDNRMWSPLLLMLFLCFFYILLQIKNIIIRWLSVVLLLVLLGTGYQSARGLALHSQHNGLELAAKDLSLKPLNQFIKECSRQSRVFADLPWNIELYFSTKVFWLPAQTLYYKAIENINYGKQMTDLVNVADIIILQNKSVETVQAIGQLKDFSQIYNKEDGMVWRNNLTASVGQCR